MNAKLALCSIIFFLTVTASSVDAYPVLARAKRTISSNPSTPLDSVAFTDLLATTTLGSDKIRIQFDIRKAPRFEVTVHSIPLNSGEEALIAHYSHETMPKFRYGDTIYGATLEIDLPADYLIIRARGSAEVTIHVFGSSFKPAPKWIYRVVPLKGTSADNEVFLNGFGKSAWELVTVDSRWAYLKLLCPTVGAVPPECN